MNIILKCFWIKNVIEATIQPTPKTNGIININPLLESGIVVVVVVSAKTLTGISGNKAIATINHRLIFILLSLEFQPALVSHFLNRFPDFMYINMKIIGDFPYRR